jgi:PDZ domain-containing protein
VRFAHTPRTIKAFFIALFLLPLVLPVNFAVIQPGEGTPLFPKVLTVDKKVAAIYKPDGQIYLLSIWVSNPDAKILGAEVLTCWARADCVVFPRSVIYKRYTTSKAEEKKAKIEMEDSQSDALLATKALLKKEFPDIDTSRLTDRAIKVSLPNVGGPSGGLIFSLALIELLTPEDILQGRKIAGSGTISPAGKVGAIGGISEKIIAAKKAGASILFAARDNCDEIPGDVSGIAVVAVSSLDEAISFLREPSHSNFRGLSGCTNLGA